MYECAASLIRRGKVRFGKVISHFLGSHVASKPWVVFNGIVSAVFLPPPLIPLPQSEKGSIQEVSCSSGFPMEVFSPPPTWKEKLLQREEKLQLTIRCNYSAVWGGRRKLSASEKQQGWPGCTTSTHTYKKNPKKLHHCHRRHRRSAITWPATKKEKRRQLPPFALPVADLTLLLPRKQHSLAGKKPKMMRWRGEEEKGGRATFFSGQARVVHYGQTWIISGPRTREWRKEGRCCLCAIIPTKLLGFRVCLAVNVIPSDFLVPKKRFFFGCGKDWPGLG